MFPSGMELPEFFKNYLSKEARYSERSAHFGTIRRTLVSEEIDSVFGYFSQTVTRNVQSNAKIGLIVCWRVILLRFLRRLKGTMLILPYYFVIFLEG